MKSEGEVRRKIKQAQFRHVKRVLCGRFPPGEKWPKDEVEKIKAEYRDFFASSPIHVIAKDFPDVAALMWVLEDQPNHPLVVNGSLVGRMGGVMLWADSDDDAETARVLIDRVVDAATRDHTQLPAPIKKSWWQRLFG